MRSLRPSLGATLRAAVAVQIGYPADLSLNQSYGYAFGPRIKYGAGSGTCQRQKSYVIIASPGEKSGLVADLCQKYWVSDASYYTWRGTPAGPNVNEAKRLEQLEDENRKLKRLLARRCWRNQRLRT